MKASLTKLLSPSTGDAGKPVHVLQQVHRLACALFLVAACIALARSSSPCMTRAASSVTVTAADPGRRAPPSAPSAAALAAAYARQREAGDRLLSSMRAAPDAWTRGIVHSTHGALWVDPFRDFYRCPGVVEKVGRLSDGGKWVCGVDTLLQRPGCVIYSFGSNGDTSFEEALLNTTKCSVWTFDPTLDASKLAKVNAVAGLNFTSVGLADLDGEMAIAGNVLPVRTLHTLMRERGHTWVDLLKMDIEGWEWTVLDGLIRKGSPLPVSQAQIEFHVKKPQEAVETMSGLVGMGWRVFHVEENNYCGSCPGRLYELSLAHVDATGQIVAGP